MNKEPDSRKLVIEIVATVENPGSVNPSIAINSAFRALGGMNSVIGDTEDKVSRCESPHVTCQAKWRYESKLTE